MATVSFVVANPVIPVLPYPTAESPSLSIWTYFTSVRAYMVVELYLFGADSYFSAKPRLNQIILVLIELLIDSFIHDNIPETCHLLLLTVVPRSVIEHLHHLQRLL